MLRAVGASIETIGELLMEKEGTGKIGETREKSIRT